MSAINTTKLLEDLLAMHDQPLCPDKADLNTLKDAMTVVSSYRQLLADLSVEIMIKSKVAS